MVRLVALTLGLVLNAELHAAKLSPKNSKEMVLRAIIVFRNQPFEEQARAAAAVIFEFGETSPEVMVKISSKVVPFFKTKATKLSDEQRGILLTAFMAGIIDEQLLRNHKQDEPVAGILQMLATYRQMQTRWQNLRVPEIEKLSDLEKSGKLKEYVSSK
jgi:hypothetical protein